MSEATHDSLVVDQFSRQAARYVESPVHADGPDLQQVALIAATRRPARVLDLGSGGGHVSYCVAPSAGSVVAFDLSDAMLAAVAQQAGRRGLGNIHTQRGAAEHLPFDDGAFELIVSRYSAHHWRDWAAGLRETRRVLAKGGRAVFIDVVSPGPALLDTWLQATELLRDPSHVRNYSVAEWRSALGEAGFAPAAPTLRRLRIDYPSWVARMDTPEPQRQSIRAVQERMSGEVRDYFEFEADGSFTFDVMTIEAG
jgi:ubiquinone/menaquinone biosynthesis C-methylase UbiE